MFLWIGNKGTQPPTVKKQMPCEKAPAANVGYRSVAARVMQTSLYFRLVLHVVCIPLHSLQISRSVAHMCLYFPAASHSTVPCCILASETESCSVRFEQAMRSRRETLQHSSGNSTPPSCATNIPRLGSTHSTEYRTEKHVRGVRGR